MKLALSVAIIITASSLGSVLVSAFSPSSFSSSARSSTTTRGGGSSALGVTSEEAVARSQAAKAAKAAIPSAPAGPAGPKESPILFDDNLLDDMQQALITLERRVQEGPNALSLLEVEELDARIARIADEMRRNEHQKPGQAAAATTAPKETSSASGGVVDAETVPSSSSSQLQQQQQQQPPASTETPPVIMDTSQDEGPAYDGKGGMGQPRGTINTYIIPGMDEMTSDEYRLALQQSLIDRQAKRKKSGVHGNRSAWNYLNSLGGENGILREEE